MISKKEHREVKFPENRDVASGLQRGDRKIIAKYARLSISTINDMMSGNRRITDNAARAIIKVLKEREERTQSLKGLVKKGNGSL